VLYVLAGLTTKEETLRALEEVLLKALRETRTTGLL